MDDDRQLGRILSRREALGVLGAAGAAAALGRFPQLAFAQEQAAPAEVLPACIVTPAQTAGPYFVDERLNRSDVRTDTGTGAESPGAPLLLTLRVFHVGSACEPLAGAMVDIWQCDALGVYSGVRDRSFDTTGRNFLRGYQVTDEVGEALFTTIYPGWYPGRAVHIHFKVRTTDGAGRNVEFTSQFYFDDAFSDRVFTQPPYAAKGSSGKTSNARDGIYRSGGEQLTLEVVEALEGYAASFDIGLVSAG